MPRPKLRPADPKLAGHRVAFVIVATLLLFTGVLLPFAVEDVLDAVLSPPSNRVYKVLTPSDPLPDQIHLHVTVLSIDEPGRTASVRVSGHRVCFVGCADSYRVLFVSTQPDDPDAEGLPPSVAVSLPASTTEVTQTVALPVDGEPIRYPFDRYRLGVGVVVQRVTTDGAVQPVPAAEASRQLFLTFQSQLERVEAAAPLKLRPESITAAGLNYPFVTVDELSFGRPLYLRVLTVLLVLLVAAAAAFAVFMRPLNELLINVGALVVGIWGVRSILVGTAAISGSSAVDLSLSVIILFLLAAITVRALMFLGQRSGFDRPIRRRTRHAAPPPVETAASDVATATHTATTRE